MAQMYRIDQGRLEVLVYIVMIEAPRSELSRQMLDIARRRGRINSSGLVLALLQPRSIVPGGTIGILDDREGTPHPPSSTLRMTLTS